MSTESISYIDSLKRSLPPGVRIEARDEEWIVKSCEYDQQVKSYVVKADGVTGVVRGMSATFLSILDKIKEVNPLDVELEVDESTQYIRSKLYLDLWLRKHLPAEDGLFIGHQGAFNEEKFQLEPAYHALRTDKHIRPRVLLADTVGMGKTIQVGVLLSELIYCGRGQRILVVCLKSMLGQLQKEFWSRFTIPLKAIDSDKLQRTYTKIPSNMNPFNYYDKVIVSMDTLKSTKWMKFLDTSYWDVIVIDECHNVARRGKSASDRSRLARKLASASDALILTSATPHDGTRESYASLLELIDPTLVIDPEKITKGDLDNSQVVFRRFGKDVELKEKIPPRKEKPIWITNDVDSDKILLELKDKIFQSLDKNKLRSKDVFLKTTLGKLFFSSPEAALSTINERLKKISDDPGAISDKNFLEELKKKVSKLSMKKTGKYKHLLECLKKEVKKDRVVIFTEYRKTQDALVEALSEDLDLAKTTDHFDKKAQIVSFHAGVPEDKQNEIIESFSAQDSKIKILVTTDIASEGVNLHFFCHNLIHFDVPWSFIILEQRNGRIHRYGQKNEAHIYYLVYETKEAALAKFNEKRVVEKLLERAQNVKDQLGDAALALCVFDEEREKEVITQEFQKEDEEVDIFAQLLQDSDPMYGTVAPSVPDLPLITPARVFSIDKFFHSSCKELKIETETDNDTEKLILNTDSKKYLARAINQLEKELDIDEMTEVLLSIKIEKVQKSILKARETSGEWPKVHLLWENNPLIAGFHKQLESKYTKNSLPVICWNKEKCFFDEYGYIIYASIFSKKGRPIKSEVLFCHQDGKELKYLPVGEALSELGYGDSKSPNSKGDAEKNKIKKSEKVIKTNLKSVIEAVTKKMKRDAWKERVKLDPLLKEKKTNIEVWHSDKKTFLEEKLKYPQQKAKLLQEVESIRKVREKYLEYLTSLYEIEDQNPYVRVIGLFVNDGAI